ncbi:alpha/beta hydrolase [Delftia sp. SD083]|nr:alpha/beta hydrolase [Delftia sp. SD083]MBO0990528.1 alpha/beta hydrolase [Delftia sp. SD083]
MSGARHARASCPSSCCTAAAAAGRTGCSAWTRCWPRVASCGYPTCQASAIPTACRAARMPTPWSSRCARACGSCWPMALRPPPRLVGFSFGGMTAGMLAAADGTLARRLVLAGAPGMGVGKGLAVRLKGWRHLATPEAQAVAHRYNLQALMLHDASLIDEDTLALHVLNVERDRLPRRRLSHTDVLARALQAVDGPVWAIYGEHDALYPGPMMQELAQAFARHARDFRGLALVPGAGHWVMHERPDAFVAALTAALDA